MPQTDDSHAVAPPGARWRAGLKGRQVAPQARERLAGLCAGLEPRADLLIEHLHRLQDADGGQYEAYRTHFKWDAGLTLRDWRYVVRIANVDMSDPRVAL